MSANKGFETKVPENEGVDSGYMSGLVSELASGPLSEPISEVGSDSGRLISVSAEEEQLDSGLDLQISEQLSSLSFKDFTPTAEPLLVDLKDHKPSVVPQLDRLFMQDDDGDT